MATDDIHQMLEDESDSEIGVISPVWIVGKKTYYYTPTPEGSRPEKKYTKRPKIDWELEEVVEKVKTVEKVKKRVSKNKVKTKKIKRRKVVKKSKKRQTKKA